MYSDRKQNLLFLCKALLLIVPLTVLFIWFSAVCIEKDESGALFSIAKRPDEYYDVILAGPSHMQRALQPAQLFGEYGMVACNTGTAAQSVPTTYYIVKDMIERHTPELVVVDLFCMFYPDLIFTPTRLHQALDPLPLSRIKAEAIYDLAQDNYAEYFIPYLLYHGRWKDLTLSDFLLRTTVKEGYQPLFEQASFDAPFKPIPKSQKTDIPEIPLIYLKKIVDLCKESHTKLLLTVIPYKADVDNNDVSAIFQQEIYNAIDDLCREWDVDFFNGLHHLDEIGFDINADLAEYSHVNIHGAKKLTSFYGAYLMAHYALPDRSGDPAYADWHDTYAAYLAL